MIADASRWRSPSAGAARADPIADFYHGRSISLILSAGAGGGYASYAQAFAPYFSAHIPGNPNIVIQNMPGGGGIRAMLYLNAVAPKDGTTIGAGTFERAVRAALRHQGGAASIRAR